MPRALDPHSTQEIVLECDKSGPKNKRPTFIFHSLSAAEWLRIANINDNIDRSSATSALASIFDPLWDSLTGWRNMIDVANGEEIKYSKKNLQRIITLDDAAELLSSLLSVNQLSGQQMGNSASPFSSNTGKSARRVRRAPARTVRRKSSRH